MYFNVYMKGVRLFARIRSSRYAGLAGERRRTLSQLLMRIQLTIIVVLSVAIQASALPGFAQRFSMTKKNVSLAEVFAEMRQQSGYDFIVEGKLLESGHSVDV